MATIDFDNIASANDSNKKYLDICKAGRYIEAVKAYKDDTGCGLAEAKAYIDNLRSEYGIETSPKSSHSNQGCMVIIGIFIIMTSLIFL